MISETVFQQLVADLHQAPTAKHKEFWKHVANIANNESPLRDYLETVLKSSDFDKHFKSDVMATDMELRCSVVLAVGYCVARPQLARHMNVKTTVELMVKSTRLSSYNKQIAIKCVWAVANVKEAEALKDLAEDVMALICDLVKHKALKDDVAVHKEILRLLDKMLLTAPKTACQFSFLSRWLVCVVNLTVSKLQVIRDKAGGLLEKHMTVLVSETDNEVNRIIAQQLFSLSTVSNIAKPTSWLLQELQQLANTGHSVYVMRVWVCLVHMTSKLILKKAAYLNEMFSVPDFFTKHLTDNNSRIALFDSWIQVIDIYRSNIPEFFANSKHMKFFMTPFFTIKQPSLEVSLALVKSWWYLVVACHRLKYMNNFSAVLEPCIKTCFKHQEAGALVQRGADILYLLLDCTPPECDLATIAPSSLNLSDSIHCTTFLKYYEMLIRYKPNCKGLVMPIWSRLCDCTKGTPEAKSMISILQTAANSLNSINVLSMIESLCHSQIVSTQHKAQLAQQVLQSASKDDKLLSVHLAKLLKSVPFEDNQYLKFLSDVLDLISDTGDKKELRVQSKLAVWENVSAALAEYTEQTGGQLNEGTRIKPEFTTTHTTVIILFKLLNKSHQISQTSIQSVCTKWERLVSLYIEHTSQYCSVSVTDQLISLILDTYLDHILLFPLIYCSKVLVEESPVPQMALLQSNSSPVFKLVTNVLNQVYNDTINSELAPPTLTLCIELCTASWNLLTPGRTIPTLLEMRDSYIGLVSQDKQYAASVQNSIQTSYTTLLSSVQKHLTFYNAPELDCLEDYLIYGLKHSKRLIRVTTAKFWNSSFGIKHTGHYSEKLRAVIQQEAKRSALIVPNAANMSVMDQSQSTEMSDYTAKSAEFPVKGSFLNRKKDLHAEVESPKPSTRNVEITAKSSKKPVTKARVAAAPRTRSVHKRQVIEDSQECIYISSSPKKQKILTKHQKEKKIEQRLDRNVPVMYNSLDVNSQEPFMFDTNSQSQALPSAPVTPEKVVEVSPPKPVTPGFSLRKMLFLSPQPNAGASTEANQSVAAKTLATLPLSSPDILTSQSDQEHAPSDSEEDLYCDPPEEPYSAPIEPSEPAITPPPSEGVMPDSGIELQASQLPVELPGNESFTPEDSNEKGGMISNVLKSMISYVVPKMVKPNTLTIVSNSDTDKSDDTGSQSSTPCDTNTTSDTTPLHSDITPLHSKSFSEISADISETSVKTTPLVPPESLIETVLETPAESPVAPLVFVEDSQNVMSEKTTATGENTIPDSVTQDSVKTVKINETAPDIQQFSNDISFTDCSTARESTNSQAKAKEAEPDRRSSRRLTKRIKSEDLGVKDSPSKFKRVKSSDDMINALTDPSKLMTPIKESEEFAMLRKSVRPRKSSAKLRDESFINTDYPASILNTNSKDEIDEEAMVKKNVQTSQNPKISAKTPILEVGKKKRGRPRKNTPGVAPLESPRKKVTDKDLSSANESKTFITIPDSQSEHNSTESSENSVVFVGEVSFDIRQTSDNTISRQDTIMIPDTPVIETAPLITDALNQVNEVHKSAVEDLKDFASNSLVLESIRADYQISQESSGDTSLKSIPDSQTSLPDNQTSVPDSQASVPDSQASVPDNQTSIPDSQTKAPDSQTSVPDSQASVPDSQTSVPDSQTSVPDSQTNVPDSQVNIPDNQPASTEAEPKPTSSQLKKRRGRPSKKSKSLSGEFLKTPTLSPINSRKSLRLTATPSETKNLITSYMSKSPKPSKKDKYKDSDYTLLPEASLEQSELSDKKVHCESSTAKNDGSVESKDFVNQVAGKEVSQDAQNDSESLTQSLAPNFQLTEEDDSPSLQLLPLPTPSQEISPQETESVPLDSSSQRRSRKQSKPKNWAAPRRKSSRLTTKSRTAENKGKEKEDSFTESLSQDSEIIELRSQVLVPDSLQPQEYKGNSGEIPINKQSKEEFKNDSETKTYVVDAGVKKETLSQILSLDISSSDKNNILSPDSELHELRTPQKHDSLQSPGYNESPTSVGSVETFGKPVAKLEFSTIQTPDPGLDTQEDPAGSELVGDTLQDPVGNTLDDLVEATLMEPVEDSLPDPIKELVADTNSPDHNTLLEDDDIPADVLKLASPYKELEEYPETDTSVIFCANSQIPSSQEDSLKETDHVVIHDSQTAEENADKLEISRTARSLKRKPSIPSNLPDEIQDLVAVQMSVAQNLEVEVKTPPKSLQLGAVGEPITPTTPKTPSSILKRKLEPGSGSPSLSKRHVTFGPLPEPHRDPNEVTPRRHSKFRKSPAPPQPKIRTPEPSSNEGAVFPSLVHSTVRAHDIIRTLCTGFTLSQRNYNLSIVSSTIKTIGDLARLTPSQIEEYPFITPKLIQVRRNLKKFEASQSPMLLFSVKSFLSETKAREMSQKSESERLGPVSEVEDVGSKEPAKSDKDSETHHYEAEEGKENMTDSDELKGSETEEPMATELEDDDKENRDPNDKHTPDDSKTEPTEQTKIVEIIEITSSQSTEETDDTDSGATEVSGEDSVQPATVFNSNSALPTTDALSEATVIQNSLSAVVPSRDQEVITVGRSGTNSTSTENTGALEPVVVSSDHTNSDSASGECKIAGSEVSRNDPEFDPEIEIVVDKRTSQVNETAAVSDATSSTEQTSESLESDESHPTASVICEDSPDNSLGLTCHEELSLSCELKKNNSLDSPSVIAETTSESSQSISQDISKTISEVTREAEFEIRGKIVESQEEGMDFEDGLKLSSTDSDTTDVFAYQKSKFEISSMSSLIREMPGLSSPVSRDEVTSTDDITHETETRASDRDVTVSDDVTIFTDITNPLVDYPLTQPRPLVDYPLTQDVNTFSFEDEIQRIEDKLSTISDTERRHNERYKIIERLCRGGRENS